MNAVETPDGHRSCAPVTAADYAREARALAALTGGRAHRIALLGSFTLSPLAPIIEVECYRIGFPARVVCGDFGQIHAPLLDAGSGVRVFAPETVVILPDPRAAGAWPRDPSPEAATEAAGALHACALRWGRAALDAGARAVFVGNAVPDRFPDAGWADSMEPVSAHGVVWRLNEALAAACRETPGMSVLDLAAAAAETGLAQWEDARWRFAARMPWSFAAQVAIAKRLARHLRAAWTPAAKCLVLDADGVLWGGVAGEDGLGGIRLGEDFPGNVFKEIQRAASRLRDCGILLALATKNDEATVREIFENHPDMILKWSDFAVIEAGWGRKSASLASIAARLGIGQDALVFFDDNPAERAEVRANAPSVHVADVPADPVAALAELQSGPWFDRIRILDDDRARATRYVAVPVPPADAGSLESYLADLGMVATLGEIGPETLPRAAQLCGKTNQFNATTRRHSEADLARLLADGAIGLWLRLRDRYADHGLTGVALARECAPGVWEMDTFLLSCRILSRKAETLLLAEIAARAAARGGERLVGVFIPSGRNAACAALYAEHGFEPAGEGRWELDLRAALPQHPPFIRTERA